MASGDSIHAFIDSWSSSAFRLTPSLRFRDVQRLEQVLLRAADCLCIWMRQARVGARQSAARWHIRSLSARSVTGRSGWCRRVPGVDVSYR